MPQMTDAAAARYARFERALIVDRDRKRAARAAMDEAGEPHGGKLDILLIDAIALMLRGRRDDDPVRTAFMKSLDRVLDVHAVPRTTGVRNRLRARLTPNVNLRSRLAEAEMVDVVRDLDG